MSHFCSGEYRIVEIHVSGGADSVATIYRANCTGPEQTINLYFGESFRLQVFYERLLEGEGAYSCGVAAAFTRLDSMEHVMYFNTNYPHSDAELATYDTAAFRQFKGPRGVVEASIPFLQLKPGIYLLTVGILPNKPGPHEFYEIHYIAYRAEVHSHSPDFPAAFYPNVHFSYGTTQAPVVTPEMIQLGRKVLAKYLPAELEIIDEALLNVYIAMRMKDHS